MVRFPRFAGVHRGDARCSRLGRAAASPSASLAMQNDEPHPDALRLLSGLDEVCYTNPKQESGLNTLLQSCGAIGTLARFAG